MTSKLKSIFAKAVAAGNAGWQVLLGVGLFGWESAVFAQATKDNNWGLGKDTDFLIAGQGLVKNGAEALGVVIIGVGVVWIGWMTISKFQEWRNGKADIGEVGVVAFGGSALLLFMAFLFGKVSDVFSGAPAEKSGFIFDGSATHMLATVIHSAGPLIGVS